MNSGLYAALTGNITAMRRLEVVSNNLANASTAGFKKDRLTFESVLGKNVSPQAQGDSPVIGAEKFYTDFAQGPLKQTGNSFDLAIEGDGFFAVQTPDGRAYTRQGNFRRDAAGKLVTGDGFEVQGKGGPIVINGRSVEIGSKGEVNVDGTLVGNIDIVDFPKPYALQKTGNSLYVPASPEVTAQSSTLATVNQGFLEDSNVSVVMEMAQMIEANRYFETCQRVVRSYDDMAAKAANEVGKV